MGGWDLLKIQGRLNTSETLRILPIYEGTNGIQALDLLKKKITSRRGKKLEKLLNKIKITASDCKKFDELVIMGELLEKAVANLESSASWLKEEIDQNPENALAGATPFLNMFGWILGGWIMCKSSLAVKNNTNKEISDKFCNEKISTSLFFCTTYLLNCIIFNKYNC